MCSKSAPFEEAFGLIELTPVQKTVLHNRFMPLVRHLRSRTWRIALMFHSGRIIITVGSLIVPALLSIQTTEIFGPGQAVITFWSTWVVSLLVTVCNALLTLFKLDKRYYYLHTTIEQLISEGWQYIELSGKYSGFKTPGSNPSHTNQFIYFCHAVEKIRMRQVEDEYFKLIETAHPPGPTPPTSIDSLLPPTPLKDELKKMMQHIQTIDSPIVNGGRGSSHGITVKTPAPQNSQSAANGEKWAVPVSGIMSNPLVEG